LNVPPRVNDYLDTLNGREHDYANAFAAWWLAGGRCPRDHEYPEVKRARLISIRVTIRVLARGFKSI
jgi:hypothetical protein